MEDNKAVTDRIAEAIEKLRESGVEFSTISDLYSSASMLLSAITEGVMDPQDSETLRILERIEAKTAALLSSLAP